MLSFVFLHSCVYFLYLFFIHSSPYCLLKNWWCLWCSSVYPLPSMLSTRMFGNISVQTQFDVGLKMRKSGKTFFFIPSWIILTFFLCFFFTLNIFPFFSTFSTLKIHIKRCLLAKPYWCSLSCGFYDSMDERNKYRNRREWKTVREVLD
jgi:hypothetical protein